MHPLIQEIVTDCTPELLVERLRKSESRNAVLLRSGLAGSTQSRYSFVTANPLLTFRSFGSRCEITFIPQSSLITHQFGNPWHLLDSLMSRYELLDEVDLPFPLGGWFGYWGYDLKNFVEPKLPRRAANDLELPDCHVGFYDSLVAFDHVLGKTWIISTGLSVDGSRWEEQARERMELWEFLLEEDLPQRLRDTEENVSEDSSLRLCASVAGFDSNLSRDDFIARVKRAQKYIRAGDIYQVNLSHRLTARLFGGAGSPLPAAETTVERRARSDAPHLEPALSSWELFQNLSEVSPAPFSAFLDCGDFQIASSSPEQFLRLSGSHIRTRPIKGTRPRSADATRDAQLAYELQTSAKENAELVMITDLLRNDLGKVCEFGSVQVPDLMRLERFAHVQHLVSTVEGRLRGDVTHFAALASCFPGGSVTGAPKIRAMEIIDELEPVSRGPYCGALGYLGFNRESQLSIVIRTAICKDGKAHFNVGAGIVADSNPEAEYDETLAKAAGFVAALKPLNTCAADLGQQR